MRWKPGLAPRTLHQRPPAPRDTSAAAVARRKASTMRIVAEIAGLPILTESHSITW